MIQKLIDFYKYPEATCRSYHGDVTDDTIQALEELVALREIVGDTGDPEGWQLVPRVPTWDMLRALNHLVDVDGFYDIEAITAWDGVLKAAPKPPESDGNDA